MTVERNVIIYDGEHGNHPVELVAPGLPLLLAEEGDDG
jgi:hypothetical protein